jgi:hypothetical protein
MFRCSGCVEKRLTDLDLSDVPDCLPTMLKQFSVDLLTKSPIAQKQRTYILGAAVLHDQETPIAGRNR